MTDALTVTDEASAAVAVAPRVSKADIEAKIARVSYFGPAKATGQLVSGSDSLKTMTICVLEMQNGFVVTGESAPASPENYNEELGQQFAYENAFRKLWPLEGYLLRERLHLGAIEAIAPAAAPTAPPAEEPAPAPEEAPDAEAPADAPPEAPAAESPAEAPAEPADPAPNSKAK